MKSHANFVVALGFIGLFVSACVARDTRSPTFSFTPISAQPAKHLRQLSIGLVESIPLPPIYPSNSQPFLVDPTGEMYRPEGTYDTLFVPANHARLVNEILLLALRYKGLHVRLYPTITDATSEGNQLIVVPVLQKVHVSRGFKQFSSKLYPLEAISSIFFSILDGRTGHSLWVGGLKARVDLVNPGTPGVTEGEIQHSPFRATVSQAIYNVAHQLIAHLNEVRQP